MLQKLYKRHNEQQGFTIIEVLIVLAIAGLILLIVFLAVPALQRNARNTGRKNDVAGLLGAMSEYTNNNGGAFPATCVGTLTGGAWTGTCSTTFAQDAKSSTITALNYTLDAAAVATAHTAPALDTVNLYTFDKCASATADAGANPTARSLVALYLVETGGGTIAQCTESGS